uniref:Peptidase S8/S53 domain-containing protein n=1 Tax=Panagrolaimus davidi TaxID=227884 RepID=A0A914PDC8_9BILA
MEKSIWKMASVDCIVWNDGEKWCACVIDKFTDDLKNAKVLTNFFDEHDYGILHFPNEEKISYSVTISNDGNLLQIITRTSDHGSDMAQLAAANFPNEAEKNGLAPGAQIISMIVTDYGDQGIVQPAAIKKALMKCIEMKVDIVSFSIWGLILDIETVKLVNEIVKEHNILIFKGAGNFGPFYLTLNPIDVFVEDSIFVIGALDTSETENILFNTQSKKLSSTVSHFSSRGPAFNGNYGIDFVAPGIASIYSPCFERNQIYQGTSISTPIAAGSVACMLSGLKEKSNSYSHSTIKEALCKSAILPWAWNYSN